MASAALCPLLSFRVFGRVRELGRGEVFDLTGAKKAGLDDRLLGVVGVDRPVLLEFSTIERPPSSSSVSSPLFSISLQLTTDMHTTPLCTGVVDTGEHVCVPDAQVEGTISTCCSWSGTRAQSGSGASSSGGITLLAIEGCTLVGDNLR